MDFESIVKWVIDNWQYVAGAVALVVAAITPGGRAALASAVVEVFASKAAIRVVIFTMDKVVKATKTPIDDMLWGPAKKKLMDYLAGK